ncbi:MAG: phosphopantothenoylcysteine decarboxylase [Planctomycetota bacterium]|nr:phosphopantothenoylcysteine decarboxylase [Planctomycetota bacterium]
MPPKPHILITAGPTREPIDAVRFISNRSSGRMGLELARAALDAGAEVTLLLGPGPAAEDVPAGCKTYRFGSSVELKQVLDAHFAWCDVLIMAAAVSDYRPIHVAEGKLPRASDGTMTLELQPTPDLVALMAGRKRADQRVVAFALEEAGQLEARATQKLRRKGVDAIVANPLGTMEAGEITAVYLTADGGREAPPRMSKGEFARWLVERVLAGRGM